MILDCLNILFGLFADDNSPRRAAPPGGAVLASGPCGLASHTNFSALRGQRVLALLDWENLQYSLKNIHGARFSPAGLLRAMRGAARSVEPLAVLTTKPECNGYQRTLEDAGFRVIAMPREYVETCRGRELRANSDPTLCFEAGVLASHAKRGDTVCLCTGDGELGTVCAKGFRRHHGKNVRIFTAGVPRAISRQLGHSSDLFDGSPIEIGQDCIERSASPQRTHHRPTNRNHTHQHHD